MLKGLKGSVGTTLCNYYGIGNTALMPLVDLHDIFKSRVPYLGTILHSDYCDWRNDSTELSRPVLEFLLESDEHIVNILILENVRYYLTGGLE